MEGNFQQVDYGSAAQNGLFLEGPGGKGKLGQRKKLRRRLEKDCI